MAKYQLKLYLAGVTPDNQSMIIHFKELLNTELNNDYSLEVIDVLENPELAEDEKILATPTVVRELSGDIKKFILDLDNNKSLLIGMNLIKSEN